MTLERAYVEFGNVGRAELPAFERALRAAAASDPRIRSVDVNVHTRRAVFAFAEGACTVAELVSLVADAERGAGVQEPSFHDHPEHPAD